MIAALVKLLPTLRWPTVSTVQHNDPEQISYRSTDGCLQAVQTHLQCDVSQRSIDYACLCEQYLWKSSCFDDTSALPDHPGRLIVEIQSNDYCHAAGSIGANLVKKKYQMQRRQIGSILHSIAGEVTSILASANVAIPTAVISSAVNGFAQSLVPTPSITASTGATPLQSFQSTNVPTSMSTAQSISQSADEASATSSTPSSTSTPSSKSGPSLGLIVGVVIGGIAVLVLLGILIMLILRHKKRKANTGAPVDQEKASPVMTYSEVNTSATVVGSDIGGDHFAPERDDEKIAYHMEPQKADGTEMATIANAWEADSNAVSELDAGPVYRPYRIGAEGSRNVSMENVTRSKAHG